VPRLRRRMADATRFFDERPYFAMSHLTVRPLHGVFQSIYEVVFSPQSSVLSTFLLARVTVDRRPRTAD
jgi:hypothetical protein